MTTPTPLSAEQVHLIFEYRALRSGLGQSGDPGDFFFTPSPKIKKVAASAPATEKTTIRFFGINLTNTKNIVLRYASGATDNKNPADLTGTNKDWTDVERGVSIVELQPSDPTDPTVPTDPTALKIALPQEVDVLARAEIKKAVDPSTGKTSMKFFGFPSNTTLIILRYQGGTPETRPGTDATGVRDIRDLAGVTPGVSEVELQAGATPLDIFKPDEV